MKIIAFLFGRCKYMPYIYNTIITQKQRDMITLTETTRTLQGCKVETSIDRDKKETRYLLTSICGKYYNVWDNEAKENIEIVGKRNFDKWASKNEYKTDF